MSMYHRVTDWMVRNIPEEQFLKIRSGFFSLKRKLDPLNKFIYGTFDVNDLRAHLEQQLDDDFEILMVHGSINHMAPAYQGSALELVRMLVDLVGEKRTLAMPAFFFGDPKIGNVHDTFAKNPVFDNRRMPSQMGLFTEMFRRFPGVLQSLHPVYRVAALGPLAEQVTRRDIEAIRAIGSDSPFDFMAQHNTKIIGIGKSYHVMTQVHHVDGVLGDDLPAHRIPMEERHRQDVKVLDGGVEYPVTLEGSGITWRFNIDKLPSFLDAGEMKAWKFHNVPMFAADARKVTDRLIVEAGKGRCLYDPQ